MPRCHRQISLRRQLRRGSIAVLPIQKDGSLEAATDVHADTGNVGPTTATNAPPAASPSADTTLPTRITSSSTRTINSYCRLISDRTGFTSTASMRHQESSLRQLRLMYHCRQAMAPRHMSFHPNGRWLYSIQEESSTLAFFSYDGSTGALASQQTISALPPGFTGTSFTSEVQGIRRWKVRLCGQPPARQHHGLQSRPQRRADLRRRSRNSWRLSKTIHH